MDNLSELLHGFSIAVTVPHLVLMAVGVLLGILVGVLPGLGAPNGVSRSAGRLRGLATSRAATWAVIAPLSARAL